MYEKLYVPVDRGVRRSLRSLSGFAREHKELSLVLSGVTAAASSLAYIAGKKVQELADKDIRMDAMQEVIRAQEKVNQAWSWATQVVVFEKGKQLDQRINDLTTIMNGWISTGEARKGPRDIPDDKTKPGPTEADEAATAKSGQSAI